ncbi:MAG: TonB-dependent receptor [Gammaproteobacteria bacterium]|mgnify:FL=1|nr:TonB-dependent receptor [Gammaproteobacteria bacterium]MBT5686301.1 TonB-dependent receptor [Gammaproteobacteria bacterium]MBT6891695.1 TonB-dependent receptor [Gammaproteobacteria bacterium]MBT7879413.1 TonB-dependent receptor [Gammaproteobacteria bacterium]
MSGEGLSTHQKALSINLNDKIYGTIAEIGAAQEVARWFFRVGAAAGSIAKTISAYDMQVSDQIYGEAGRYVSRERVTSMLNKEYELLLDRLDTLRGQDTRFFAFCDTIAARNFSGTNECQGWVGLKFQSKVGGEPNTIIAHINMLDDSSVAQQEAVGILGVNLIHSAFANADSQAVDISNLVDNLGPGRMEVDLVDISGPAFEATDSVAAAMVMVQNGLADAVLLDTHGQQQPPTEIIRKRPSIIRRTTIRYSSAIDSGVFAASTEKLLAELPSDAKPPLHITEFSINNVHASGNVDTARQLEHLRKTVNENEWVMLTRLSQSYKLSSYIRRYSQQPLRFVMGVSTLTMLFSEQFYQDSDTGLLEALGKLFTNDVKIAVQSMTLESFRSHVDSVGIGSDWFDLPAGVEIVSVDKLTFHGSINRLFQYVLESECIEALAYND